MTEQIAWHNGEFLPRAVAKIAIDDGGWLHGAGLFETMRAENGRVFRLATHLDRLCASARELIRHIRRDELPHDGIFEELLGRNDLNVARLRLTVSAGSMLRESTDGAPSLTVSLTAAPLAAPPPEVYATGVQVMITRHRVSPSDPIAPHKTIAYLPRLIGLREAQKARCMEALWFTTGRHLAEGSLTNVFIIKDHVVKTPPLGTPVLPGVTRAAVLDLAPTLDLQVSECPISIDALLDADEVFLTNVIMLIMPVIRIEKHDVAGGRVGHATARLQNALRQLVRRECGYS